VTARQHVKEAQCGTNLSYALNRTHPAQETKMHMYPVTVKRLALQLRANPDQARHPMS